MGVGGLERRVLLDELVERHGALQAIGAFMKRLLVRPELIDSWRCCSSGIVGGHRPGQKRLEVHLRATERHEEFRYVPHAGWEFYDPRSRQKRLHGFRRGDVGSIARKTDVYMPDVVEERHPSRKERIRTCGRRDCRKTVRLEYEAVELVVDDQDAVRFPCERVPTVELRLRLLLRAHFRSAYQVSRRFGVPETENLVAVAAEDRDRDARAVPTEKLVFDVCRRNPSTFEVLPDLLRQEAVVPLR